MATRCHHDGNPHGHRWCGRGRWEGSFLAQPGEAETCAERSFSKSFSPHSPPREACAERSFWKSFSPRRFRPQRPFWTRLPGKPAQKWPFAKVTRGQRAQNGHWAETCAERSFSKSFSPHRSPWVDCAERSFWKSFSPRRFRLRQAVPKRNPPTYLGHTIDGQGDCHHGWQPLPS